MPSVFEKGVVIRKFIILLIFWAGQVCCLPALDVYLNQTLYQSYTDLAGELYPVTPAGESGISLDEILPLMIDAYRLIIRTTGGEFEISDDLLAEELQQAYLVKQGLTWAVLIREQRFAEVTALRILGEPVQKRELEIWLSWEGVDLLKGEIRRFAARHGIDVKAVNVPQPESKLLSVLRGGGTLPDIVMIQSSQVAALQGARALQNLNYMVTADLQPKGLEAFLLEHKQWAIPLYFDTQLVFYNPELIPSPLPLQWDLSLLENLSLQQKGVLPVCWNAYSAYWLIPFQWGFGKESLIEADGSIKIDDPPTRDALAWIRSLQTRGVMEVKERDAMVSLFISGKSALILSASYSIPAFTELGIPFAVAPFPYNKKTGRYISPLLDFKGLAVTYKSRRPVLARRLIQFLTGTGVQQRFTTRVGKIPANRRAWAMLEGVHPYYAVLDKSCAEGTVIPPAPAYPVFKNTLWKLLRFIFTGGMSIEEALKTGQEIMDVKFAANP